MSRKCFMLLSAGVGYKEVLVTVLCLLLMLMPEIWCWNDWDQWYHWY